MAREYTEKELKAWSDVEQFLAAKGLVVYEHDGKEESNWNANRIIAYYDANPTIEITVRSITEAVELMKNQMKWLSKAEMAYNKVYRALSKADQDAFGAWWHRSAKKYIETEGIPGFENAAKIIIWCSGRSFEPATFDLCITNLFSTTGLHPSAPREQGEKRGHKDDGKPLLAKEDVNVTPREHARLARERAEASRPKPAERPDNDPNSAEWQRRAEAVSGNSHSDNQTLDRMMGKSWEETFYMRQRFINLKQGSTFRKTAV
jgi:hypothetical protein